MTISDPLSEGGDKEEALEEGSVEVAEVLAAATASNSQRCVQTKQTEKTIKMARTLRKRE